MIKRAYKAVTVLIRPPLLLGGEILGCDVTNALRGVICACLLLLSLYQP